jgi:hypothetical protein
MRRRSFFIASATAVLAATALFLAGPALAVTVTGFTPAGGVTGDDYPNCAASVVQVTGAGFVNDGPASAVKVSFNGTPATFVQINADNSITTAVPKNATTGPISVTTAAGTATSSASINVVPCPTAASTTATASTAPKTPSISVVTPAKGKAGALVVITGLNFSGATSVKFGGTAATFTVVSATKITAKVPARARSGKISVTTAAGTGTSPKIFVKT